MSSFVSSEIEAKGTIKGEEERVYHCEGLPEYVTVIRFEVKFADSIVERILVAQNLIVFKYDW